MGHILLLAAGMMLTADVASGQPAPAAEKPAAGKPTASPAKPAVAPAKPTPASAQPTTAPAKPATAPATTRPAGRRADEPRLTQEEIQKLFDAGDYNGTLLQLNRVLPLKGDAAAGYERYALLMLKAETHLRLKQVKSAGDAFGAAAKETKDEMDAAKARATQRVLKESKNGKVQRKTPAERGEKQPTTADVLDPAQREDALRIVHADLRAATTPQVKAALRERTLPPISDAFERLGEVRDLELAVTGGDAELAGMRRELAERATELIGRELARLEKDVAEIRASAETVVKEVHTSTVGPRSGTAGAAGVGVVGGAGPDIGTRQRGGSISQDTTTIIFRGLSSNDRAELRAAITTSKKIVGTLDAVVRSSDGALPEAEDLITRANETRRAAERTLAHKY